MPRQSKSQQYAMRSKLIDIDGHARLSFDLPTFVELVDDSESAAPFAVWECGCSNIDTGARGSVVFHVSRALIENVSITWA